MFLSVLVHHKLAFSLAGVLGVLGFWTAIARQHTPPKPNQTRQERPVLSPTVAATPTTPLSPTLAKKLIPTLTPKPTKNSTPTPTKKTAPQPATTAHFSTLSPGSKLPSNEDCAVRVRRSSWEPREDNKEENNYIPVKGQDYDVIVWGPNTFGQAEAADLLRQRIDGKFTGTTDEILQWAACKWGIDEDIVRAQAVQESWWRMSQLGDTTDDADACDLFGKSAPCDQSYGILQVKASVHRKTFPASVKGTAFNADYTYAYWRSCYDGHVDWLRAQTGGKYDKGDEWGCLGFWYSGSWHDSGADDYIGKVKAIQAIKRWSQPNF